MQYATKSNHGALNTRDAHHASATFRSSRGNHELASEAAVSVLCVSVLLALSLGAVVGYGLGRALVSLAPSTLDGGAP